MPTVCAICSVRRKSSDANAVAHRDERSHSDRRATIVRWAGVMMTPQERRGLESDEGELQPVFWLFDSRGLPVACRQGRHVFSPSGAYLGRLEGDELWNGSYRAELVRSDRLLRALAGRGEEREVPVPPPAPELPAAPAGCRGAIGIPVGFRDVHFE